MTRRFHSFLTPHLKAYLEFRQKLGYTSYARQAVYIALDFDYYLVFHGLSILKQVDEGLIAAWVHAIPQHSAITKNKRLLFARGLFHYMIRIGAAQTNPARRIPSLKVKPYKPYIYTLKELQLILTEARRYTRDSRHPLLNQTLETMFFLIYACGLRLGEARNLKIQDVNFEENTLALWKTKFHKERLVPFSPAVAHKLKAYLALRSQHYPPSGPDDHFFCHAKGQYYGVTLEIHFRAILVRCGLAKPKGRGAPRIHDLRHAFAVHRLYKWYQEDHDLLNKLPLLSTYMGHVNIEATQVYLTITRALLREGSRRFHDVFGDVAQKALKNALKSP